MQGKNRSNLVNISPEIGGGRDMSQRETKIDGTSDQRGLRHNGKESPEHVTPAASFESLRDNILRAHSASLAPPNGKGLADFMAKAQRGNPPCSLRLLEIICRKLTSETQEVKLEISIASHYRLVIGVV